MLEAEGLTEHEANKGARVPRLTMHEVDVVYRMRERLEPLAHQPRACRTSGRPTIERLAALRRASRHCPIGGGRRRRRRLPRARPRVPPAHLHRLPDRAADRHGHPAVELHRSTTGARSCTSPGPAGGGSSTPSTGCCSTPISAGTWSTPSAPGRPHPPDPDRARVTPRSSPARRAYQPDDHEGRRCSTAACATTRYDELLNFEKSERYDDRQKAALAYAEAIAWGMPADEEGFWDRLHEQFSEPELAESKARRTTGPPPRPRHRPRRSRRPTGRRPSARRRRRSRTARSRRSRRTRDHR